MPDLTYNYFPGCSLERNAEAYHKSSMAATGALGMRFREIDDWNCCGATEYISLHMLASYSLIARNLAQAAKSDGSPQGGAHDLVAPCSACYLNLKKTDKYLRVDAALAEKVSLALAAGGLAYKPGSVHVRHLLDVIMEDVGCANVKTHVTRPLKGLRLAPYYGCLISRPGLRVDEHNPEYPMSLDQLMSCLGAQVVDFPLKTHCCGGHMTQISEATGFELIRRLVKAAADYQADMIVTVCPMCQLNLDAFQGAMNRYFKTAYHVPVLYFTQMMGLAFGLDAETLGIGTELVDARPALAKIGVEVPPAPAPSGEGAPKRKRDDKSLPMPKMPVRPGEGASAPQAEEEAR
jgi:heterodisulfide reductase subunit B2